MSNIDLSRMITAADKEAAAQEALRGTAREECRRRITALINATAQINLAAAAAAGLLTKRQIAVYQEGLAWIGCMRAVWPDLAQSGADPGDDANWPAVPPGMAQLADLF